MANSGSFRKGEKRANQGKHGPPKATLAAKEAIARFVDGNAERLQGWLDQIAEQEGPKEAFKCFADVLEYHVPKLARTEVGNAPGDAFRTENKWIVDIVRPAPEPPGKA